MTLDLGHILLAVSITCWLAIAWDSSFAAASLAVDAGDQGTPNR